MESAPLPTTSFSLDALRAVPRAGLRALLHDALRRALAEPPSNWGDALSAAFRVEVAGPDHAPRVFSRRRISVGEAFVAPHTLTATKAGLAAAVAGAGAPATTTLRDVQALSPDADDAEGAFWYVARASGELPNGHSAWHLEPSPVCWMRHASAPGASVRVFPIPTAVLDSAGAAGLSCGASFVFVEAALAAGAEATRDHYWPRGAPTTLSRATAALAVLPRWRWAASGEHDALARAVSAALATAPPLALAAAPPVAPPSRRARADASDDAPPPAPRPPPLRFFTDDPLWSAHLRLPGVVEVTAAPGDADILWLARPVSDFASLPRGVRVNQFPFEGCLVRKDLLPATARAAAAAAAATAAAAAAAASGTGAAGSGPPSHLPERASPWPPWFEPCYDLATEAHQFLRAAGWGVSTATGERVVPPARAPLVSGSGGGGGDGGGDRAAVAAAAVDSGAGVPPASATMPAASARAPAAWIVKRATGTHSGDPVITASPVCALRFGEAATPGGDRVAQAYAPRPLLLAGGRKFDLRVYVAVRAFGPVLDAAYHTEYYARTAAAPYADGAASLAAFPAHFSVGFYEGVASGVLTRGALAAAAAAEAGVDWDAVVEPRLAEALAQLFAAAGAGFVGGPWPGSRGLYGVDVLVHWVPGGGGGDSEGADGRGGRAPGPGPHRLQPSVLEVNFAGDVTSVVARLPDDGSRGCRSANAGFVSDVVAMLFVDPGAAPRAGWRAL